MICNYPDPANDYSAWRDATDTTNFPSFVELLCAIRNAIGFEPRRIFDFGYGWGISQCLWLTSFENAEVVCCDPLGQGGYAGCDPVSKLPQSCLDRWTFVQDPAEDVLVTDIDPFDFIFVDADHGFLSTLSQVKLSWEKLEPGGVMAGHDWFYKDVQGAVNEFMLGRMLRGDIWDIDNGGWMVRK